MASDHDESTPTAQSTQPTPRPVPVEETDLATTDDEAKEPDSRPYIEITPTDTPLSARAIEQAMAQLHSALDRATDTRLRDRLFGEPSQPGVEWLLVGDGHTDTSIRWFVGVTDPELHDECKRILRTALPNTYELQTVAWHPAKFTTLTDTTDPTQLYTDSADHPDTDTPLAGVDIRGHADRLCDWQTPLTAVADLTSDRQPTDDDTHRLPLTTLVETIRDADAPVLAVNARNGEE